MSVAAWLDIGPTYKNCEACNKNTPMSRIKRHRNYFFCLKCYNKFIKIRSPEPKEKFFKLTSSVSNNNEHEIDPENFLVKVETIRSGGSFFGGMRIYFIPEKFAVVKYHPVDIDTFSVDDPYDKNSTPVDASSLKEEIKLQEEKIVISINDNDELRQYSEQTNMLSVIRHYFNKASFIDNNDIDEWIKKMNEDLLDIQTIKKDDSGSSSNGKNKEDSDLTILFLDYKINIPNGQKYLEKLREIDQNTQKFFQTKKGSS